jgi:uncharacterized protein (DUF362 family)
MTSAIPRIRAHLKEVVIPNVRATFANIRQNKKYKDHFDENRFKEKIVDEVFELIET